MNSAKRRAIPFLILALQAGLAGFLLAVARWEIAVFVAISGMLFFFIIKRALASAKGAEERFRLIFESSPNGFLTVNRKGVIILVNVQAEKMFGYTREELIGRSVDILVPERFRAEHPAKRQAFMADPKYGRLGSGRDFYGVRKDGTEIAIEIVLTPMAARDFSILCTVVDLTERKRALDQERQARIEAQRAIQVRDNFLAIASHELQTPLTPLMMHMEMAKRRLRDVPAEVFPNIQALLRALDNSDRELKRLTKLIRDLLDVSRLSAGPIVLKREQVDLAVLVRRVVERARPELDRSGCSVLMDLQEGVLGYWDPARMGQVIDIMLSNAIKYGAGQPIGIALQKEESECILRIRDRGMGMSSEVQAKLFQRFGRMAPIERFGGLGMGLFIAREILHAHQGSVEVQSEPGKGAEFLLRIPLAEVPAQPALHQGRSSQSTPAADFRINKQA